jgi:hypothetical protein
MYKEWTSLTFCKISLLFFGFETLNAVKIRIGIFWVVIPCNEVDGFNISEAYTAAIFLSVLKVEATYAYEALVHGLMTQKNILLWHLHPLLGSDCETNS